MLLHAEQGAALLNEASRSRIRRRLLPKGIAGFGPRRPNDSRLEA